jgi:3-hydroxyacyl-[acyl-carrier-protein] dehydratase
MENILLNDFFFIKSSVKEEDLNNVVFIIELNTHHRIFNVHFPQQAVVPGVCMVQMIEECVSEYLNHPVNLVAASTIKYTNLMLPMEGKNYKLNLNFKETIPDNSNQFQVSSSIHDDTTTFIKFQGSFRKPQVFKL